MPALRLERTEPPDIAEDHVANKRYRVPVELHIRPAVERLPVPLQHGLDGGKDSRRGDMKTGTWHMCRNHAPIGRLSPVEEIPPGCDEGTR